jgi:hypothetical protein
MYLTSSRVEKRGKIKQDAYVYAQLNRSAQSGLNLTGDVDCRVLMPCMPLIVGLYDIYLKIKLSYFAP